ncbi:MAG: ATP-binding protein [Desulfovibrio sp.]|nr:ATP-binding protein [Desulfovibrio sp.]
MNKMDWDLLREGWSIEAKLAQGPDGRGELPSSFWETYSAFANTNGGIIVLGASERADGSFDARGIVDIDKIETNLWSSLQNPMKVSANILSQTNISHEEINGKWVIVIHIQKAPRSKLPVYINPKSVTGVGPSLPWWPRGCRDDEKMHLDSKKYIF